MLFVEIQLHDDTIVQEMVDIHIQLFQNHMYHVLVQKIEIFPLNILKANEHLKSNQLIFKLHVNLFKLNCIAFAYDNKIQQQNMFDDLMLPKIHHDHFDGFFLHHNRHRPHLTNMANAKDVLYKQQNISNVDNVHYLLLF